MGVFQIFKIAQVVPNPAKHAISGYEMINPSTSNVPILSTPVNQLTANQLNGFHMVGLLVVKGLITFQSLKIQK